MGSEVPNRRVTRRTSIETLEARLVFSADPLSGMLGGDIEHHAIEETDEILVEMLSEPPLAQHGQEVPAIELHGEAALVHHAERNADFWVDHDLETNLDELFDHLEQTLANANNLTGATQARADYGFTGVGQTVAVIDSGIAWDHAALGGGLGANYRVVGGWDFTENDANPYDDGPEGSHGSHVAGIIGAATGGSDSGVAPGVDLVGLRVFNDAGDGFFSWVSSALTWVHTNRNSFENPITAINLSLGTAWNSASVPGWAMLEDEFALLEADGIFISVSAGNSYATYNAKGLSYPAASSHVVPVMSVDDNGNMSSFSQRHERAIAAPGRTIRSTVPDYAGNHNGVTDDWASFSGTSMAAPYVAGASAIVRQAMEFVGQTGIDQWDIYDHMMATADDFFDSATNTWYKRLDVKNAIDALMPVDDFGSSVIDAYNMGALGAGSSTFAGTIGKLSDSDFFRFTASVNGTVSFTADTSHEMVSAWSGSGVASGNSYTIDVVAGQSYTVGLATTGGVGHYTIDVDVESTLVFTDWGTVAQTQTNGVAIGGETWYRVTASQAGYLTTEAFFAAAGGNVDLAWFDLNLQQVASGVAGTNSERVDRVVGAGEQLYLRVTGANADVDFRLTNLVSLAGTTVTVNGTSGNDTFEFTAGATQHTASVNGVSYDFDAGAMTSFSLAGGAGNDTITMTGTAGNETATLRVADGQLVGAGYSVSAAGIENMIVHGGGGSDRGILYDSAGNDVYTAWRDRVTLAGNGYLHDARGFASTTTYATTGVDRATFYNSALNDTFCGWSDRAVMYANGYFNDVRGFDSTVGYGSGSDRVVYYDSVGDDVYATWSSRAAMYGAGYFNDAYGFGNTIAYATQGNDRAVFYDSVGDDVYAAWSNRAAMYGTGYFNDARNFRNTIAYSTQGNDRAVFYDSVGADVYAAWSNRAVMYGTGYFNDARNFRNTIAYSTQGSDRAVFYDSAGDDVYAAWSGRAAMYGASFINDARGFRNTIAYATAGGHDRASLYDSAGNDKVVAAAWGAYLSGSAFHNEARGFEEITVLLVNGGDDERDIVATDYFFQLLGPSTST